MKKLLILLALVAILVVSMTSVMALEETEAVNPDGTSTMYTYVQPLAAGCWYKCSWCPNLVCTAAARCC